MLMKIYTYSQADTLVNFGLGRVLWDMPGRVVDTIRGIGRGAWEGLKTGGFPGMITGALTGGATGWYERRRQNKLRANLEKSGVPYDEAMKIAQLHKPVMDLVTNKATAAASVFRV